MVINNINIVTQKCSSAEIGPLAPSKKEQRVRKSVCKEKAPIPPPEKNTSEVPAFSVADLINDKNIQMMVIFITVLFLLTSIGDLLGIEHLYFYVIILFVTLLLLIVSSERFLNDAKALAKNAGIPEIVIGLTIVSIGTSIPEIASTGMASYHAWKTGNPGLSDFVIGNIYGSVLVQITLVLGFVVLVKPMVITRGSVRRDGLAMIGAVSILSVFILIDGELSRAESLVLITLYLLFIYYLYKNRKRIMIEEQAIDEKDAEVERDIPLSVNAVMLGLGLGFIIYSSNWLVISAVEVAQGLGIPEGIIGLTVSAVGTSLPELAIALAAVKSARGVAIGTLIGSNVTDPLLSVGIAGVIYPVKVSTELEFVFPNLIVPFTIFACVLGVLFMWTKKEIVRWEGAVLLGSYFIFIPVVLYFM